MTDWKENRMRHAMRLLGPSIVLSMAVALTGCMWVDVVTDGFESVGDGFESDLVPGRTPAPAVGTARFYIADMKIDPKKWPTSTVMQSQQLFDFLERLRSDAVSARPNLFSDDFSAVPLVLDPGLGSAGFTDLTLSITVPTMEGDESLGSVAYKLRCYNYKLSAFDGSPSSLERMEKVSRALYIEAVVKALGQCDAAKLQALYDSRKSRIQSLSLDGKPCWGFVGFSYSKPGASSGPRDVAWLFYTNAPTPTWKTAPADGVVVARRGEDGRWRPCTGYLRTSQTLTAASVLLENGLPGRVVLRPVEEPEIDDFIDLPVVAEKDRAESIRWSNGVLLQVRNRSIPRLVRERSGTELLDLATRLEKVALTLDEVREKHNDRAKQLVELGTGDPAPDREMAILYGLRQEVFRAILATIKQESARKKP
jgi:hypothetical protein